MRRELHKPEQIRLLRALRIISPVVFCWAVGLTVASWIIGDHTWAVIDALLAGADAVFVYIQWCVLTPARRS